MPPILNVLTTDARLAKHERRIRRLEMRGPSEWHYVGDTNEPPFENGWSNAGGTLQTLRYRFLRGGGIEIQGSVTGGTQGTVVFTLPTEYRPDNELRLAASDDQGAFIVFRVLANGQVIFGV